MRFSVRKNRPKMGRLCSCIPIEHGSLDVLKVAKAVFAGNENRLANRVELEPQIDAALLHFSLDEAEARLEAAQVPYSRMNDVADVLRHPQVLSRGRLVDTALPGGRHAELLRPPFNIEGLDDAPAQVPEVGQHTDAVLAELGYSTDEISALRQAGAV